MELPGFRQLYLTGSSKGVPQSVQDKILKILFAMETAAKVEDLGRIPGWRLQQLHGDMGGLWSLTVTGNWRVIIRCDEAAVEISDLDFTDYH